MAITFDHAVKYNGQYYPANTPIKEDVKPANGESQQAAGATKKATKGRKKGETDEG